MEQEFQEDEDQEQQSQQAESGSNLNDASMNQDDDPNQHNQLEISKDKKQIKRICLFPIKREWRSERQIFLAFCILQIVVLCVICGIILGNMNIATYLIEQSALTETQTSIQNTLQNSVKTSSNLYLEVFYRYSVSLQIITKIFLSSLKLDDTLYDEAYSTFPLTGPQKYINLKQSVPSQTPTDLSLGQYYQGNKISLDYIQYFSYSTASDWTQLTTLGQQYLGGADVLNHFLKNMVYFLGNPIRIQQMYLSLGSDLQVFFPGGVASPLLSQQGTDIGSVIKSRPWYTESTTKYPYNITGPYIDLISRQACITISLPILTKNKQNIGVIGLDILLSEIVGFLPYPKIYDNGQFYLVNYANGLVINGPSGLSQQTSSGFYLAYNTSLTNITSDNWSLISNSQYSQNQSFEILDVHQNKVVIFRQFLSVVENSTDTVLILFVAVPHDEAYGEYNSIQSTLKTSYHMKQYYVIITAGSITLFSLIVTYYFVKTIVFPLQELADCTKEFTNQEKKSNSSEIKKKKQFEDIKTSDNDIEDLISSFKKLIKDLSGFKKGTRRDNQHVGEDNIEYPRGDGMETGFYRSTKFLFNYSEFQDKLSFYIDQLQKFQVAKSNREVDVHETEFCEESQYESEQYSHESYYYKIESSFLNFIEIVLNSIEQMTYEQTRKGQLPQIGKEDMELFLQIKSLLDLYNNLSKHIVIYDKFKSFANQNNLEYDDQEQDPIQDEDISNMPQENLQVYDRKSTSKRFDQVISKFKKIESINIQQIKRNNEKKNVLFLKEILPNESVD